MADQEHKHGEMDISVQEETFNGFIQWTIRGALAFIFIGIPVMLLVA
ncbi:MAG: aa3-type cytochrome c oxidase subunit IV [Marinovum sp.]|nr:aa3-type cytochrome c oxidase subunit IV [Marinovum sp.]